MITRSQGEHLSFDSVLDCWLNELRRRRWVLRTFGARNRVVAAMLQWGSETDVVIVRSEDNASAYRLPVFPGTDVFAPELVSWQHYARASWVIRAVLTIEPPGRRGAPVAVEKASELCAIPPEIRKPKWIQPDLASGIVENDGLLIERAS
jgi:hypothetical protein